MKIVACLWLPAIIEKLIVKHQVQPEEVEEVFAWNPLFRRGPKGKRTREDVYYAYGQTEAGRYLFVVFIHKSNHRALILSARDMSISEQRLYRKHI